LTGDRDRRGDRPERGVRVLPGGAAEKPVEALAAFLPARAHVWRDGRDQEVPASALVPGDVLVVAEGESICADARLIAGALEVDLSMLTGESAPVSRSAEAPD